MNFRHWGEMPPSTPEITPNVSGDIEKSMEKFFFSELDSNGQNEDCSDHSIVMSEPDPLVIYAISLHQHMNSMTDIIRLKDSTSESLATRIPPIPDVKLKHKLNCLNFIPKDETDFTLGKDVEVPVLSEKIVDKVLRKSVCTLFAHIGYETTHESIIEILVDVLKEFYKKFLSSLEISIHDETENNSSGFPHAIERVLVELGLGGVKGLHDYYQCRVIKYVNVLLGRCKKLNQQYDQLLCTATPAPEQDVVKMMGIEIKKEEIEENPEVHLLDGEIELSSLETGFQLLNTLEEANLQNLMEGDEILTTESPGNVPSEVEYSPLPKKKK